MVVASKAGGSLFDKLQEFFFFFYSMQIYLQLTLDETLTLLTILTL